MAKLVDTKEELALIAQRMTAAFSDGTIEARLKSNVEGRGMMFAPQLIAEAEKIQATLLSDWGYAGDNALAALHNAVKTHPDLRPSIVSLCEAEESMLDSFQAALAKAHGIEMQHGHSHNGEPCDGSHGHGNHDHSHGSHGHSHNGQPCHGHGDHGGHNHGNHGHSHDSHGHSHNGQPCHGHGAPQTPGAAITQQIIMQMAQKGMPPENLMFMQQMQRKMMSGQQASGDEQLRAMQIQQTMMKKVQNLSSIVPQAVEALSEEEHASLLSIESNLMKGQGLSAAERSALEGIQSSIATYCATMGPMLARMQQQQQQQLQQQQVAAPASSQPEAGKESKKRD